MFTYMRLKYVIYVYKDEENDGKEESEGERHGGKEKEREKGRKRVGIHACTREMAKNRLAFRRSNIARTLHAYKRAGHWH